MDLGPKGNQNTPVHDEAQTIKCTKITNENTEIWQKTIKTKKCTKHPIIQN